MNKLNIEKYRKSESHGRSLLPNRILEAFSPAHFEKVGYPVRLHCDEDIIKFVDAMHERRHDAFVNNLFGGSLTESEFELLDAFASLYWGELRTLNKQLLPIDCLLNSLHAAVPILNMSDSKAGHPMRVFEVGPGSGYLSGMLRMKGVNVMASDICEGFYLCQDRLYSHLFMDSFLQLAHNSAIPEDWTGIVHLPWWIYVDYDTVRKQRFDVIAACHCVTEMHPWAFKYFLKFAQETLSNSELGYIVIDGWGSDVPRKPSEILQEAYSLGWKNVYSDGVFTVLKHGDEQTTGPYQALPWDSHTSYDQLNANHHRVSSWRPRKFGGNKPVKAYFQRKLEQRSGLRNVEDLMTYYAQSFPGYTRSPDAEFFELIDFYI